MTEAQKALVERVKDELSSEDERTWQEFVNHQELGQCQVIAATIAAAHPEFTAVVGEVETDQPYQDEDGEEQTLVLHHWVELDGVPLDFAKGTLRGFREDPDPYDPEISEPDAYHTGTRKTK